MIGGAQAAVCTTIRGDASTAEEADMSSVARITQISARSDQGFDDAVRVGVDRANATLRNVTGAWVKDQKVEVEGGQISAYQVVLEVTFILD
jgi:flavin-binding protein dodecin